MLEAASVLTTVATKGIFQPLFPLINPWLIVLPLATMNQQAYGKMGMQILINLLKQFPNREFVHDLVAQMIANVSANRISFFSRCLDSSLPYSNFSHRGQSRHGRNRGW